MREKPVPQTLRASFSLRNTWLLPGFWNHDILFLGAVWRAEAGQGAEKVGMEPPELVIGAKFLLLRSGYSDGLFYVPEMSTFISLARIEAYNAMICV